MSKKTVFAMFLLGFAALTLVYCGSSDSGGGNFGKPAPPLLSPSGGQFSNPTNDDDRPFVTITSQNDIRYSITENGTSEAADPPDPDCGPTRGGNFGYMGPFQIGGPDETVRIKAIACDGDAASVIISSEDYVFSP